MTDPARALSAYQQRVQDIASRADATRSRLAGLRPAATSPDGAVTVTVSSAGALVDLTFGPAAEQLELAELARLVVATAQTARADAARQTEAALAELVGEPAAHRAVAAPAPPDPAGEDDESGYRGRGF